MEEEAVNEEDMTGQRSLGEDYEILGKEHY
jgi:hypothetical protein